MSRFLPTTLVVEVEQSVQYVSVPRQ